MKSFAIYYKVDENYKDEPLSKNHDFNLEVESKELEQYADVGELHMKRQYTN